MTLYSKFLSLIRKNGGFLPPNEKKVLKKAYQAGAISRKDLDKLMTKSTDIKKRHRTEVNKNPELAKQNRFKAAEAATKPQGKAAANELSTSSGMIETPEKFKGITEAEEIAETVIAKVKKKAKKPQRLRTDAPIVRAAKMKMDVGEKFLRNKKAQAALVKKRMKVNDKLKNAVDKAGSPTDFVNSTIGQRWVEKAISGRTRR